MTDLFTEKDFVDDGGYHKRADYIRDMVNERMKALIIERDEARELARLAAEKMAQFIAMPQRERGEKHGLDEGRLQET